MAGLKSLAKDTAIYGLSSIVGRFLNYMLVPLYTAVLPASTGGYGVVSNVYAFTALMLVLLTFGMETGFFRFANKSGEDPMKVYANSLLSVGGVSLIFVFLCLLFLQPISNLLDYGDYPEFIAMMAVVVALDSFQCIPFAYLRYKKRPIKFAAIKLLSIVGGIGLNLFFLLVCPWLNVHCPSTISWFYDPDYLVGYIFISNLIISVVQMFFFIPELTGFAYKLDKVLLKRMVVYSFPVLILGLVGILNQTVDKMIYPFLFEDRQEGLVQLGIYAATSKIAMVMAMFTQAFRYAYEPFVFGKDREGDNRKMYAAAMKYFLIFSLLAFLAVMFYLDLLRYLVARGYWEGLGVVAIVMHHTNTEESSQADKNRVDKVKIKSTQKINEITGSQSVTCRTKRRHQCSSNGNTRNHISFFLGRESHDTCQTTKKRDEYIINSGRCTCQQL